jgi:hypothetical protein
MNKSDARLYLLSRQHLIVCGVCTVPLLTYSVLRNKLIAGSQMFTLIRTIAGLTAVVAMWAFIRALSSRVPQMGAPYYSDDGTLSASSEKVPRDLSIPWGEVAVICIEFVLFAGVWILAFRA